jgi:hypothetical protein
VKRDGVEGYGSIRKNMPQIADESKDGPLFRNRKETTADFLHCAITA